MSRRKYYLKLVDSGGQEFSAKLLVDGRGSHRASLPYGKMVSTGIWWMNEADKIGGQDTIGFNLYKCGELIYKFRKDE